MSLSRLSIVRIGVFVLITSLIFYIIAVITSIIDPAFNLSSDFCTDWQTEIVGIDRNTGEEQTRDRCVSFKNNLSEQMYYYNLAVKNRNYYLLGLNVIISSIIAFYTIKKIIPDVEERKQLYGDSKLALFIAVLFIGPIGSLILGYVLPAPSSYTPFIAYQIERWESDMKRDISSGHIYINSAGKIIK